MPPDPDLTHLRLGLLPLTLFGLCRLFLGGVQALLVLSRLVALRACRLVVWVPTVSTSVSQSTERSVIANTAEICSYVITLCCGVYLCVSRTQIVLVVPQPLLGTKAEVIMVMTVESMLWFRLGLLARSAGVSTQRPAAAIVAVAANRRVGGRGFAYTSAGEGVS